MLERLTRPTLCRRAFWLCALAVLALSLMPAVPHMPSTGWDKSNHLLAFAVLALLGCLAWPGSAVRTLTGLLAYGALIEVLQSLLTYRFAEWADLLADAVGLVWGWGLAGLLRQRGGFGSSLAQHANASKNLLKQFVAQLLTLPRPAKRALVLALDVALCVLCVWVAFGLRLEQWQPLRGAQWWAVVGALGLALPLFVRFGLYHAIFRYSGELAGSSTLKACGWFGLAYIAVFTVAGVPGVPRSIGSLVPLLLTMAVYLSRRLIAYLLSSMCLVFLDRKALPQVAIYGAGAAGRQIAAALTHSREMVVRCFVDDDPHLQGGTINGMAIVSPQRLLEMAARHSITDVVLAMPSLGRARRAEIVQSLQGLQLHVRTIPGLADLVNGRVQLQDMRELDIEDLLGRDPVAAVEKLLHKNVRGKVVLVTGAGGSIGRELCRQLLQLEPATLLLVDVSEYALYAIHHELQRKQPVQDAQPRLRPLLASVRDEARMREIFETWQPDTVYHAAAYKHVPLVEHNPAEGIKNNTFGTLTTAQLAAEYGAKDFVLISTDKAVRPTNIMGSSKRLAEMVLQGLALQPSGTRFSMVRFGNVLGSSGSVVPLFRQQIRDGGPITLTHADITRYFMTIPEAAQLVIQAGAMATGGDMFVLDMGDPVRIVDLARRMVELSGMTLRDEDHPDGDIEICITGLRPGEKLYEELLIGDNPRPTLHPRILKAHEDCLPWPVLQIKLQELDKALCLNDVPQIRGLLQQLVHGYQPDTRVVDWVHLTRQTPLPQV